MSAIRERLDALNNAACTELDAITRGETTQAEATDRLVERFFPRLGGVDRDPLTITVLR